MPFDRMAWLAGGDHSEPLFRPVMKGGRIVSAPHAVAPIVRRYAEHADLEPGDVPLAVATIHRVSDNVVLRPDTRAARTQQERNRRFLSLFALPQHVARVRRRDRGLRVLGQHEALGDHRVCGLADRGDKLRVVAIALLE